MKCVARYAPTYPLGDEFGANDDDRLAISPLSGKMALMDADPFDTAIDYAVPPTLPSEELAKRRRGFLLIRWTWRLAGGAICAFFVVLLTWCLLNGEMTGKWYALPLLPVALFLLWAMERARFCPDCNAQFGLPIWRTIPAYCTNCQRLLQPIKVMLDPPGVLDLNNERYLDDAAPVVKLIAMVILLGVKDHSSEIRLEPGPEWIRVRYRCDGVMYDMVPPPLFLHKAVSGTLKAMAELSAERRSQNGKLTIKLDGHSIASRVESEPTEFGENVVVWLPT